MPHTTGAGELRDRVLLLSPVRHADSFGDRIPVHAPFRWVWARFRSQTAREITQAEQTQGQLTATVRVRAAGNETVGSDWRLIYRENIYELTGPPIEVRESGRLEFFDLPVLQTEYATGD